MLELLTLVVLWSSPASRLACTADAREDLLPGVIAPMLGRSPVWLVDGTNGRWFGSAGVKSIWVLEGKPQATLTVTGKRVDGIGTVEFQTKPSGPSTTELVIMQPGKQSMIPGGASAAVMEKYAFVSSYISYPAAGCWELTAEVGGTIRKIVLRVE